MLLRVPIEIGMWLSGKAFALQVKVAGSFPSNIFFYIPDHDQLTVPHFLRQICIYIFFSFPLNMLGANIVGFVSGGGSSDQNTEQIFFIHSHGKH